MLFRSAIQTRRSIRHFDPNYTIPKEDLHKIVDLTLLSPTAMNKQGIDLVVVTNRQKIDEATEITFRSIDARAQKRFIDRQHESGVNNALSYDASCIIFLTANERADPSFIGIDTGIMCMSIMAAARHYNYQAICLGILLAGNKNELEKLLGIGKDKLLMAVALGKPAESAKVLPKEQLCKAIYIE
mgnify:CR=1 FL=1